MSYDLESIFCLIVADQTLHARWLNTFSYLEYIGFRKIVKSQASNSINSETLAHAVEEGRHALLLKKLAMKIGGAEFDSYAPETLLCAAQGASYFQQLDRSCELLFSTCSLASDRSRSVYLCVTWLVEARALSVYTLYQKAVDDFGIKTPLTGLLAEEDRHLASVESELRNSLPDFAERLGKIKTLEENLYNQYLLALSKELGASDRQAVAHA
jgi:hypothetical protein